VIRAHAKAIVARLEEDLILRGSTFQGVVTNRPARYCTVFMDSGLRVVERFNGLQTEVTFGVTVHSVGTTAEQSQLVAERVMAQLLDYRPIVAGRDCRRLRHVSSVPVDLDTDVSPPLYFSVDQFDLTSSPA
jgi:hypothetical protein